MVSLSAAAAELPVAKLNRATPVDFPTEVYPVLKANCIACHNKTTTKASLNMETPDLMKKGGENGPAIVPGKGGESLLLQSAAHQGDSDMPPKGNKVGAVNLKPEELGLLKLWIDQGAKPGQARAHQIAWQPLPPGLHPIYAVAMAPTGDFAACSRASQIFVYDLGSRQQVAQLAAHRDMTLALAFSPDGTRLASGSFGEVKLWKRETPGAPAMSPAVKSVVEAEAAQRQAARSSALAALDSVFQTGAASVATAEVTAFKDRIKKAQDAAADTKKKLEESQKAADAAITGKATATLLLGAAKAAAAKAAVVDPALAKRQAAAKAWLSAAIEADAQAALATEAETDVEKSRLARQSAADSKAAAQKVADEIAALVSKASKPDAALEKKLADAQTKFDAAAKAEMAMADALKAAETAATDAEAEVPRVTKLQADAVKAEADAKAALAAAQQAVKKTGEEATAAEQRAASAAKAAPALLPSTGHRWLIEPQADGSSLVWAMGAQLPVAKFVPKAGAKAALTWKPDGTLTWPADSGALDTQAFAPRWVLERTLGTGDAASVITDRVNALAFSPDGKSLAVGSGAPSRGGDITLWDAVTGRLVQAVRDRHSDAVLSLDFSPDGKLIASGGADKQVRVSEVTSGKLLKTFEGHTHHVMGVAWRADGRVLASSGADNAVKIWDWIKGERRKNLDGWDKEVTSLHYLGASPRLLTTCGDKQVRLIGEDGTAPVALAGTTDFMQTASASFDGRWIAAGGEDSVLRVWDAKAGTPVGTFAKP